MEKTILLLIGLACLALLLMSYTPDGQAISGLQNYRTIQEASKKMFIGAKEGQPCEQDSHCGPNLYCIQGACVKLPEGAECKTTKDCATGLICNKMGFCEKQKTVVYDIPRAREEFSVTVPEMPSAKPAELKEKIDQLEKELESFTQEHKKRIQELKDLLSK